jgi:hypothetical protein
MTLDDLFAWAAQAPDGEMRLILRPREGVVTVQTRRVSMTVTRELAADPEALRACFRKLIDRSQAGGADPTPPQARP